VISELSMLMNLIRGIKEALNVQLGLGAGKDWVCDGTLGDTLSLSGHGRPSSYDSLSNPQRDGRNSPSP
jgi:hypothetical protein